MAFSHTIRAMLSVALYNDGRGVSRVFDTIGLVRVVSNSRGTVVEKDGDAIVQWYLRRAAAE